MLWEIPEKEDSNVFEPTLVVQSKVVVFRDMLHLLYICKLLQNFARKFVVLLLLHLEFVDLVVQNGLLYWTLLLCEGV